MDANNSVGESHILDYFASARTWRRRRLSLRNAGIYDERALPRRLITGSEPVHGLTSAFAERYRLHLLKQVAFRVLGKDDSGPMRGNACMSDRAHQPSANIFERPRKQELALRIGRYKSL